MKIGITWQVTTAVIDADSGDLRFYRNRLKRHEGMLRLSDSEEESGSRLTLSRPVLIIITGSAVASKPVTEGNPAVAKILKSGELYITVHTDDEDGPAVDFIRKDSVSDTVSELERKSPAIMEILVTKRRDIIGSLVEKACEPRMTPKNLLRDIPLLSACCNRLYMKIRLPLLLAYLGILAANWIIFNDVSGRIQEKRAEIESVSRVRKAAEESDIRQKSLEKKFMDMPGLAVGDISGKIAGSVPGEIRLNGLHITSEDKELHLSSGGVISVTISGETFNPGSIVELSDRLAEGTESWQADISSIKADNMDRKKLKFEIEIRL